MGTHSTLCVGESVLFSKVRVTAMESSCGTKGGEQGSHLFFFFFFKETHLEHDARTPALVQNTGAEVSEESESQSPFVLQLTRTFFMHTKE